MSDQERAGRRVYQFGPYRLDVAERRLLRPGQDPIPLTPRRLAALVFLLERPNRLLTKQVLLDEIWCGAAVEENALTQVVSWLRRVLGDRSAEHRYIETVPGVGYRFVKPVSVTDESEAMTAHPSPSIAVLPFEDLSPGGDQAHVADGIAEEILNLLGQIPGLRVVGRASSFAFRGPQERPQIVGQALAVEYLLTGAVRKHGERIRVTAQLIEAATGLQAWSERLERTVEDVFALQDDIAAAVSAAVDVTLGDRPAHGGTSDPEAHDLYLRARAAARRTGAEGMLRAAVLYREALALDPAFTLAWLGLAEASRGIFLFAPAHAVDARQALEEAAQRAVALSPDLWASHLAEGWRLSLQRDWIGYERALARAAELARRAPSELSLARAVCLMQSGRMRAAAKHARLAARDDPLSLLPSNILQMALHAAGRDEESEKEYRRSLDLPGVRDTAEHTALQRAWLQEDEALIEQRFARYLEHQTIPLPALHRVFEVRKRREAALKILRAAADEPSTQAPVPQMVIAWWLARYGDADSALATATRAQLEFEGAFCNWLWFPVLAQARRNPRFKTLLARLGLPTFWRTLGDWGDFASPIRGGKFECS